MQEVRADEKHSHAAKRDRSPRTRAAHHQGDPAPGFSGRPGRHRPGRYRHAGLRGLRLKLDSQLGGLSAGQRSQADQAAESLLLSAWENQSAGGGAKADALLKDAPAADRAALSWKLLYATYLTGGPKVSSGQKKEIAAVPEGQLPDLRQKLLTAAVDEGAELPAEAKKAAGSLSGAERQAMLFQLLFLTDGAADDTEQINSLKKGVRDKAAQLDAFRMIARGEVSGLWQLVVANSRTAILLGILLALDALLLTFLMMGDKVWKFDFKWIIILLRRAISPWRPSKGSIPTRSSWTPWATP